MISSVNTFTPANVMKPVGPYSHIAQYGDLIMISATAGVNPETNELAGPDIESQTAQILDSFQLMLVSVGSDFEHIMHINVFLKEMDDFAAMNRIYAEKMVNCRPARSAIGVTGLPKPGAKLTMSLTAVARQTG